MAHTYTWNAAFEAVPATGDDARLGAGKITDFKIAVRERLTLDHRWEIATPDSTNDGYHDQVTYLEQVVSPAAKADAIRVYTLPDVGFNLHLYARFPGGEIVEVVHPDSLLVYKFTDDVIFSDSGSVAHGFSATPDVFSVNMLCNAADGDFEIGDEISVTNVYCNIAAATDFYGTVGADATNVFWDLNTTIAPTVFEKGGGGTTINLDTSKWEIRVRAIRFS